MCDSITIRYASSEDADRLLSIYAAYVEKTAITFEYKVPSKEEFMQRIQNISARYPYLAAWQGERILGYAYASSFKNRAAYDWSVETSIYVDETAKGMGIGSLLYRRLEELLKQQNICNLCACIAYPNPESIRFHEKHGYRTVAHFHKSGYKLGSWYDMIWMEKFIGEHTASPAPVISIQELIRNGGK